MSSSENKLICSECIGNGGFSDWIEQHGQSGQCDFEPFHEEGKTVTIKVFSEYVDSYFRENYQIGEEMTLCDDNDHTYYERRGELYENIIGNDLDCWDKPLEAIVKNLPDCESWEIKDGAYPFYDSSTNYESRAEVEDREAVYAAEYWYENRYLFQWDEFCESVQYKNRFFNVKARLDDLFSDAGSFSEGQRCPIHTLPAGSKVYRARKLGPNLQVEDIKKDPQKILGYPPKHIASEGRMNFKHIPVFYAAFALDVAVIEVQPYIDEKVVVGTFVLNREIKIFDFTVYDDIFDDLYPNQKIFKYGDTRYKIIHHIQQEMSKPISSINKSLDYIPTQILTEYIKEHFQVEGIVYFSSLIPHIEALEKRNIVIFGVEDSDLEPLLSINSKDVEYKTIRSIQYEIADTAPMYLSNFY